MNREGELMFRISSLIVCATLSTGLLACGSNATNDSSAKNPLEFVPLDNQVSGWLVDSSTTKSGSARAATASSLDEAVGLIDGGAAPFYKAPYSPKMFVWQNFANSTLPAAPPPKGASLMLYILQMPSEDQARGLYADLRSTGGTDYSRLQGTAQDWQDPTTPPLGTDSRIEDTGAQWWVNFYKGVYYAEVMLFPSYGPAPDYVTSQPDLKKETLRFAEAVASKM
jgi:hypothetical protein